MESEKQIEMNKQEKQNCQYREQASVIRGERGGRIGEMVKGIKSTNFSNKIS